MQPNAASLAALGHILLLVLIAPSAAAQVVFDDTFGPAGAAPTRSLDGRTDWLIDQDRGLRVEANGRANLFHSLLRFDIGANESASFRATDPVDSVIARVTGGTPSTIAGLVRSEIAGADVFLVNPSGILITETASLDLPGSFFTSTADFVRLDDGSSFPSSGPVPSVTAAPPSAFGFGPGQAADIVIEGNRNLILATGATFGASGGDVTVRDGTDVFAYGGSIEIAATGSANVEVPVDLSSWSPRADAVADLGQVNLENGARLSTLDLADLDGDQGRVVIRAGDVGIDAGLMRAGSDGIGSPAIDIESTRTIDVIDASVRAFGAGMSDIGGVRLSSDRVAVSGGGLGGVSSETSGSGGAGDITIDALELRLSNGGRIQSDTLGAGPGGAIRIDVGELHGSELSEVSSRTSGNTAPGNDAGAIVITADRLLLESGARIDGTTEGSGRGADITLQIDESITLAGDFFSFPSGIFARSGAAGGSNATGAGGRTHIVTGDLIVRDGAQISSSSRGDGDAGSIDIDASGTIALFGAGNLPSGIFAVGVTGAGGDIDLDAGDGTISITDGAFIDSAATATGAAGNVTLSANLIEVDSGAQVSARATGLVDAGQITLTANDIAIGDGARVLTDSAASSGGNILITATDTVEIAENALVKTDVRGNSGQGGNFIVDAEFVVVNTSDVTANAFSPDADAGNIFVTVSGGYFESTDSVVEASNLFGVDGLKVVNGPINPMVGQLVPLDIEFLDASEQLRDACAATGTAQSSFSVQRNRAPPPPPDRVLDPARPIVVRGSDGRCETAR